MSYQDEGYVVLRYRAPSGAMCRVCLRTEKDGATLSRRVANALVEIAELGRPAPPWHWPLIIFGVLIAGGLTHMLKGALLSGSREPGLPEEHRAPRTL